MTAAPVPARRARKPSRRSCGLDGLLARMLVRLSNTYRRMLAVFLAVIGPRAAYAALASMARCVFHLYEPLRLRSEVQCRAALGDAHSPGQTSRIAEQAFVHRAWNLADLMLAERLLRRSTYHRYGGRIPEPHLDMILTARRCRQPVILVTAYYGPFDLLPLFLGFNGIQAAVVYRPHANPDYDAYRRTIRARSGCEMVTAAQAINRLPRILQDGGTVALLSDHHAARRGIPITFLGLETAASRSVGLLAMHYGAVVAVAGIRRLGDAFRFEIIVSDLFKPDAWHRENDPVTYITRRYVRGLERIVLQDPAQYLWANARWGQGLARQLASEARPPDV